MSSTQMTSKISGADGGNAQPNISLVPAQNTLGENVAFTWFFLFVLPLLAVHPANTHTRPFQLLRLQSLKLNRHLADACFSLGQARIKLLFCCGEEQHCVSCLILLDQDRLTGKNNRIPKNKQFHS